MNKNQVRGAAKNLTGKVLQQSGKMIGSKKLQLQGLRGQLAGKAQQHRGNLKAAVKAVNKVLTDNAKQ